VIKAARFAPFGLFLLPVMEFTAAVIGALIPARRPS
jgi:hypothetical protein